MLTMGRKQYNNTANHFFEMPYRHAGAAPALQTRRVWAQAVNGAWLGFYIMGPLSRLEDRAALNVLKSNRSQVGVWLIFRRGIACSSLDGIAEKCA